jgi:hypothetical protein
MPDRACLQAGGFTGTEKEIGAGRTNNRRTGILRYPEPVSGKIALGRDKERQSIGPKRAVDCD